jgi:phasin family protein
MFTTPDQMLALHKATLEAFQAVAVKSLEGFEKLAELNMAATRTSMEESADHMKAMLEVKDVKALADMAAGSAQPATDKFAAYAKHVYEISNETGSEIAKLVEKQFADSNRQLHAAIDALAKSAPAGSEGIVTFVKQAVSAANTAYDQVNKATRQVVEMTEANVAAAGKTATAGAARARKAA